MALSKESQEKLERILLLQKARDLIGEREDCEASFRKFVRAAWPVNEPGIAYMHARHLDALIEHFEAVMDGSIKKLIINISPRCGKSILGCIMLPAWVWISNPSKKFVFASYDLRLSMRDSRKCNMLIKSSWYQKAWGDRFKILAGKGGQDAKQRFDNDHGGHRIATSTDAGTVGEGGDVLYYDDGNDIGQMNSEAYIEKVIFFHEHVMASRLNDPRTGARICVQQRCDERDITGHILSKESGWEHLVIPMEYEGSSKKTSIGWSDWRTKPGELMWPEKLGPTEIADFKKNELVWSGQYQQRPAPAEGNKFKRDWWNYWNPEEVSDKTPKVLVRTPGKQPLGKTPKQLPKAFEQVIHSWDLTFKGNDRNDFVVGQVWGRLGADFYLIHQRREHMDFPQTLKAFRETVREFPATEKLVEDKANGPAVISTLKNEIPGIIAITPDGGKEARANAAAPYIEAGNVFLPNPDMYPWVYGYIEEFAAFPNARYDDQCFAAGTMIATSRGDVPIEKVLVGDKVLTPFGLRKVTASGQTGFSQVIEKLGVSCTKSHKIFADGNFFEMDALTQASRIDRLSLCGLIHWKHQNLLNLTASPTGAWEGRDSIISASRATLRGERGLRGCMLQSGNLLINGQFLRASLFITKTIIPLITIPIIWSRFRISNIVRTILSKIKTSSCSISLTLEILLGHGIIQKMEKNGIENMGQRPGKTVKRLFINASIAVRNFLLGRLKVDSVQFSAVTSTGLRLGDMMSSYYAQYAVRNSRPSSQSIHQMYVQPAANCVLTGSVEKQLKPVYNLTVERDHVYYANGILVSNCDCTSMAVRRLSDSVMNSSVPEFRVVPRPGEPQTACHIEKDVDLAAALPSHWRRWISVAPGAIGAAIWLCELPSGALRVYREMRLDGLDAFEVGRRIAEATLPDIKSFLGSIHATAKWHMDVLMEKTAFQPVENIGSYAELLEAGLYGFDPVSGAWEARQEDKTYIKQAKFSAQISELEDAALDRLRDLLRFQPPQYQELPYERAKAFALAAQSVQLYQEYMAAVEGRISGEWPKIRFASSCVNTIAALGAAMRDKDVLDPFLRALLIGVVAPASVLTQTKKVKEIPWSSRNFKPGAMTRIAKRLVG